MDRKGVGHSIIVQSEHYSVQCNSIYFMAYIQ